MMGLPNWLHWLGWYITVTVTCSIIVLIMTLVLVLANVFQYVDPVVLFLTLFFYCLSIISFNFAVSTIFSNRKSEQSLIFYHINFLIFSQSRCCSWYHPSICYLVASRCGSQQSVYLEQCHQDAHKPHSQHRS